MRRWLEEVSGPPDAEKQPEGLNEQIERWADELGYLHVAARHLIAGAPRFTIGELRIEGLEAMQLGGVAFDIVGENLSTNPRLLDATPHLSLRARDGSVALDLTLAGAAKGGGTNAIDLTWKGLSGDAIGRQLKVAGTAPIRGGTIDLAAKGTWGAGGPGTIDLPFQVTLHDTTLALPGVDKPQKIDHLELPLRVTGALDDPRILFREEDLAAALVAAGRAELADKVGKKIDEYVPEDVKKQAGGLLDRLKGGEKK